MSADGPRKLKVSMGYFWNMFLPVLAFIVFGAILLMILQWPDDMLDVMTKNVKSTLNISGLDPK